MATAADVRELLRPTSLPATFVNQLLAGVSPLWLMGESAEAVAGDLVLCHPPLVPGETRATIRLGADPDLWHLTVVSHDRAGLLAATAGVLVDHGLSIRAASATSWETISLALQRLQVSGATRSDPAGDRSPAKSVAAPGNEPSVSERQEQICADLRRALGPSAPPCPTPAFSPLGPVDVSAVSEGGNRSLIRVRAPDRPGLVWAVSDWLAENGCRIELARIEGHGGRADDTFVVIGAVDTDALARRLSGHQQRAGPPIALSLFAVLSQLWRRLWAPWEYLLRRR